MKFCPYKTKKGWGRYGKRFSHAEVGVGGGGGGITSVGVVLT